MPGSFFDTNVLLYVASGDRAKADRAEELIRAGGVISVQVLNEIANVARRKMGLSWSETRAFLSVIRGLLPVQPLTWSGDGGGYTGSASANSSSVHASPSSTACASISSSLGRGRAANLANSFALSMSVRVSRTIGILFPSCSHSAG